MSEQSFLTIVNWKKHNPRSDVKHSVWSRIDNGIFFDPKFHDYDSSELMVWIFLLSMASRDYTDTVRYAPDYVALHAKVPKEKVLSAVEKLIRDECVVTSRKRPLPTGNEEKTAPTEPVTNCYLQTNETNKTNITNEPFVPGAFFQKLLHDHSGPPLQCKVPLVLSPRDQIRAKQRWDEMPDEGYWYRVMAELSKNDMFTGKVRKSDGTKFRITLGYLLKPEVHLKAMNGDFNFGGSEDKKVWEVVE